jgi:hypothetical protein
MPTRAVSEWVLGFGLGAWGGSGMAEVVLRYFVANFLGGVPQTLGYECRANVRGFGELADFTFPATDENGTATGARGGFEVGDAVADHVAIFEGDAHIGCGLLEHGNAGFAAVAFLTEFGDFCFGMMQAIVNVIDVAAGFADGGQNRALEDFERFALEVSLGDAGLIGNDRDEEAEIVEEANGFGDAREELELGARERGVDDAGVVMIDEGVYHAIAIE